MPAGVGERVLRSVGVARPLLASRPRTGASARGSESESSRRRDAFARTALPADRRGKRSRGGGSRFQSSLIRASREDLLSCRREVAAGEFAWVETWCAHRDASQPATTPRSPLPVPLEPGRCKGAGRGTAWLFGTRRQQAGAGRGERISFLFLFSSVYFLRMEEAPEV